MKKLIICAGLLFAVAGCAAWEEISQEHLDGNKYYEGVYGDAWDTLKEDYLK